MSSNYCHLIIGDPFYLLNNQNITFLIFPSILLVFLDLILDPIAVDEKRWMWKKSGSYYGVPLLNFVGWFFTTFLILYTFKMFQSDAKIDKEISYLLMYSPGILLCILPAIASRPCFERGLKLPGVMGLILSIGLVLVVIMSNN
tara:strand:+ start:54 stop:485 length:432 start_codon:yes stop_codon:yes gene_type:complete